MPGDRAQPGDNDPRCRLIATMAQSFDATRPHARWPLHQAPVPPGSNSAPRPPTTTRAGDGAGGTIAPGRARSRLAPSPKGGCACEHSPRCRRTTPPARCASTCHAAFQRNADREGIPYHMESAGAAPFKEARSTGNGFTHRNDAEPEIEFAISASDESARRRRIARHDDANRAFEAARNGVEDQRGSMRRDKVKEGGIADGTDERH